MIKKLGFALIACLGIATAVTSPAVAGVPANTVSFDSGGEATENCWPFGCFSSQGGGTYQQVYSASGFTDFGSLVVISSVSFFGTADGGTYSVKFFQTDKAVGELSTVGSENETVLLADFGTFSDATSVDDVLTFAGGAFAYNPLLGNLLMSVTATFHDGRASSFLAQSDSPLMSRAYSNNGAAGADGYALDTRFGLGTLAVPEPAVWLMMIGGFGLVGGTMRSRRGVAAAA